MIRDRKFEVSSVAQLTERVVYKNPNSSIHHKKQLGKDPESERAQLRKLPFGGSWVVNCEDHEDFFRLGQLCIQTGHRGIPRKRIGRSLVWSLPDGMQALLLSLPKKQLQQMLRFLVNQFKEVLQRFFPGVPCVMAIHCDKARIHLEALLLKYHFTVGKRGKVTAHLYESFKGYCADSAYNTAHVASSVFYGLSDPGFGRVNSRMTRVLTSRVNQKLNALCRSLEPATASTVARDALETFNSLRVIRSDSTFFGDGRWHRRVFAERRKARIKDSSDKARSLIQFLKRGRGFLASWMADWSVRMEKIRKRRLKKEHEALKEWGVNADFECDQQASPSLWRE